MKENKARFPWKDGANFETVDPDGRVFQIIQRPYYKFGQWRPFEGWFVGNSDIPQDASTTLIERYPSEQATNDQTPDLLTRLNSRMDSVAEIIERRNEAALDYRMRIEALEAEVKRLRYLSSEMMLTKLSPSIEAENIRFVVPRAKSVLGTIEPQDNPKAIAKTDPDPTAQKVEALKLIFGWRDGCEFMTVDERDGSVWQWSVQPEDKIKGDFWTALGRDTAARRVGEITPDPELSKIIITRANG